LSVVELQPGFRRRIEIEQSGHDLRRLADIGADGKRGQQFGESILDRFSQRAFVIRYLPGVLVTVPTFSVLCAEMGIRWFPGVSI
jgi:hypothetical protein